MNLRKTMARLKKLLRARDVDLIEQGVELVAALDDPQVWATLLEGVRYDPEAMKSGRWASKARWRGSRRRGTCS